jgi:long-chain fatty acid transport protein
MPEGPEALSVNPAAIAWLDRAQAKVGVCVVNPTASIKTTNMYDGGQATTDMDERYHLIPHAYVSTPLYKQVYFGLGMYSRFGLAAEYDKTWPGRYNSYLAEIESFSVTPVFSFKINDQLAIAGGLEFMYFDLKLSQTIDATKYLYATGNTAPISAGLVPPTINDPRTNFLDVNQKLEGDSKGYGYNLSLSWMPKKNLGIGITYRSEVHQKVTGGAQYETSPLVRMIFGNNLFQFSDVSGKLDLPAQILVGINYKPTEKWNLGVSAIHTMWSSYDALKVEFQNMQALACPPRPVKRTGKMCGGIRWVLNTRPWTGLPCGLVMSMTKPPLTEIWPIICFPPATGTSLVWAQGSRLRKTWLLTSTTPC